MLEDDFNKSDFPQVVWIEPKYTYAYRIGNDDHPDASIFEGQLFLGNVYKSLRSDPGRWAKTLLIITYDEHGGFFDHVVPPKVSTSGNFEPFTTAGLRVPAFLISPYVRAGVPFHQTLDHTCMLALIDKRFSLNRYPVDGRGQGLFGGLDDALADAANLPDTALIRQAMDRISPRAKHSNYEHAYLAAAKERAQNYVYIGPDFHDHAANILNPRLLGMATDRERRNVDDALRRKRAVIHTLMTPALTYTKKQQIAETHAVTTKQLHEDIKSVIASAKLAVKLKPSQARRTKRLVNGKVNPKKSKH
jgi:hypothetical protein